MSLMGLKSRCWQGCVPSGDSRGEFIPLPLHLPEAARSPAIYRPSLPPSSECMSQHLLLLSHLPPFSFCRHFASSDSDPLGCLLGGPL